MFEIESNKLGEEKGNAAEKTFASQMVKDHTKTSNELKELVSSGKVEVELPTVLDSAHQAKLRSSTSPRGHWLICQREHSLQNGTEANEHHEQLKQIC